MPEKISAAALGIISLIAVVFCLSGCDKPPAEPEQAIVEIEKRNIEKRATEKRDTEEVSAPDGLPLFVGREQCVGCHQQEAGEWQGSHHDLAMQEASTETVLGDFENATFDYFGVVSTFFKRDGRFFVNTDGPDGKLTDYPIAYTFGVSPLQQYLIRFPNGKLQALNVVWDSRPEALGGQRWFHLYPQENIKFNDELHWTGINQNWNFMCADCHSTNLQKNYDPGRHEYSTTWSEIDVSCEACHGPGSVHVAWAGSGASPLANKNTNSIGLTVAYNERKGLAWSIDPVTGNAKRSHPKSTVTEVESCARCHSRRLTQVPGAHPEALLLDNYRVALLDEGLYHADGQVDGEVYVYGSFVQSKMYYAGVTCSDCHKPHSLQLRAEGNGLCAQCHLAGKYDNQKHHLHPVGSKGAQCVGCHMPAKNYMVVDARRDHSFRIPRPDLSVQYGVPNACTDCHQEKAPQWARDLLAERFGVQARRHFTEALFAGRHGLPTAEALLNELLLDKAQPAIARATAASLLPRYATQQSLPTLQSAAMSTEPFESYGLADGLEAIPQPYRPMFAVPLLYDDARATRMLAADALHGIDLGQYPEESQARFNQAIQDYVASETFNAERPESMVNLAEYHARRQEFAQAEALFQQAIQVAPYYTPAYVNLADFYRSRNRESDGEALLRQALLQVREPASIQHALGLLLVRQNRLNEALEFFRQAATGNVTAAHYQYVYAIALNSAGQPGNALQILEQALAQFPADREILAALISINREQGNAARASEYEAQMP